MMFLPRPFTGAFQSVLRSRWNPIASSSRIENLPTTDRPDSNIHYETSSKYFYNPALIRYLRMALPAVPVPLTSVHLTCSFSAPKSATSQMQSALFKSSYITRKINFSNCHLNKSFPDSVRVYFCLELVGLSGLVMTRCPNAINGLRIFLLNSVLSG